MLLQAEVNGLLFEIPEDRKKKSMVVQRINGLICNSNFSNEMKIPFKFGGDKSDDSDEEKSPSRLTEGEILHPVYVEDNAINVGVALPPKDMKCESNEEIIGTPGSDKEDDSNRKRKRESMIGLLNWITEVAKNPCDPAIGLVPERSKWKSYGIEMVWKRVLLVREERNLQRHLDSSAEQSSWQKNQRMHPSMYDDQSSGYNFRERLRRTLGSSSGKTASRNKVNLDSPSSYTPCNPDQSPRNVLEADEFVTKSMVGTNDSSPLQLGVNHVREHVRVGARYQAKIPEWSNEMFEGDSKWLGTRVWPLENGNNKFLIERDRIGKGRMDSCGCQAPGSCDCVKFHVAEKRLRLKLELCSAFDHWEFDKMGEKVSTNWVEKDERKFEDIVRLNPPSLEKCFWDEIVKLFPKKSRADLVSYYFNVFLLRRREYQNRFSPHNIDSDDDVELESKAGSQLLGNEKAH